eukprot:CCRYP_019698-RA/>CCRYP_019698-RA protein AED:0.12 eAED:0.12 QI:143/0.75/1/1/0.5/0.4/5/3828/795
MDEEHAIETPAAPKEVASSMASSPSVAITNGTYATTQTTDALTALSTNTPEDTPYIKRVSLESVQTPDHVHILALQRDETTPQHNIVVEPSSPTTTNSTNTHTTTHSPLIQSERDEVERLRREAARIKEEQARLEEEIRMAKLQKDRLEQYALTHAHPNAAEDDEDIEIYCENPIDVMSAITEEPRTLVLEKADVEVMSQITEARTEARHFHNGKRRKRWIGIVVFVLLLVAIAAIVGGVRSRQVKTQSASVAKDVGDSTSPTAFPTSGDTTSPTRVATLQRPIVIDMTDDDDDFITPVYEDDDDAEIVFPTPSPSVSSYYSSTSPSLSAMYARIVKIQSNNEAILNVFEVQVIDPSGGNVAFNKNATQSSTWEDNFASYAVDGADDTFSSTLLEERAWWQVDLEQMMPIENVTIMNYYCFDESDQGGCLGRLSNSTLVLIDEADAIVSTKEIRDTDGLLELTFHFDPRNSQSGAPSVSFGNPPSIRPNSSTSSPPSASPILTPSLTPTSAPIQVPTVSPTWAPITQLPSLVPSQSGLACPSDEGLLSIFFQFGTDPNQISWYVVDDCTGDVVAQCDLCYENADPYATSADHRCLPMAGYTFYFSDAAGDVWPTDSGFSVVFDGDYQYVQGSGTTLEITSLSFGGGGSACPTVSPTSKSSALSTTLDKLPFPYSYPYARFTQWEMLADQFIIYAESLGYNSYLWNNPNSYDLEYNYVFASLNSTQQQAITDIGLSEEQWDCFMNHYESYGWESLPDHALQALIDLGWSQCVWDREPNCSTTTPASEGSNWRLNYY